ncbi:hypothetical protein QWY28_21600 [Nocardioides sp. SOB77]|uniref:Helix-turn-helix domain-containing protein n=1 Tax=Nocardioides oceani TaxID=3058369 RepID=A0ABT8FLM3_9ACTN|nr:hypothetical protein [Nocardioides oceani]MDN4175573.1 hypothetical protein [Nocardioides oceani]
MDQDMADAVLSTKALASRWDTTPARLANMRSQGRGPTFFRIGTRVLYRATDVLAYEADRRVEASTA